MRGETIIHDASAVGTPATISGDTREAPLHFSGHSTKATKFIRTAGSVFDLIRVSAQSTSVSNYIREITKRFRPLPGSSYMLNPVMRIRVINLLEGCKVADG